MAWRDSILHNYGLKLFSLLLAVLIWLSARSYARPDLRQPHNPLQPVATRQILHLPIQVLQAAGATPKITVEPAEAHVTISGEPTLIQNLSAADLQAFVRVADVQTGATNKPVEVFLPPGVNLLEVAPPRVHIQRLPP